MSNNHQDDRFTNFLAKRTPKVRKTIVILLACGIIFSAISLIEYTPIGVFQKKIIHSTLIEQIKVIKDCNILTIIKNDASELKYFGTEQFDQDKELINKKIYDITDTRMKELGCE